MNHYVIFWIINCMHHLESKQRAVCFLGQIEWRRQVADNLSVLHRGIHRAGRHFHLFWSLGHEMIPQFAGMMLSTQYQDVSFWNIWWFWLLEPVLLQELGEASHGLFRLHRLAMEFETAMIPPKENCFEMMKDNAVELKVFRMVLKHCPIEAKSRHFQHKLPRIPTTQYSVLKYSRAPRWTKWLEISQVPDRWMGGVVRVHHLDGDSMVSRQKL